jgi:hypothetical protein
MTPRSQRRDLATRSCWIYGGSSHSDSLRGLQAPDFSVGALQLWVPARKSIGTCQCYLLLTTSKVRIVVCVMPPPVPVIVIG